MDLAELKASVTGASPPPGLPALVRALWHDAAGNWETAHEIAQEEGGRAGAWVHAYLHRKEGDLSNASYWYRLAKRSAPEASLDAEWDEIASELLAEE